MSAESTVAGIISNAQTFAQQNAGMALDQAYYMGQETCASPNPSLIPLDISWIATGGSAGPDGGPLKASDIAWNTFVYPIRDSGMSSGDIQELFNTLYHDLADGVPDALDSQIDEWMDKYAPMPDPALLAAQDAWLLGVINGTQPIGLPAHVADAMWAAGRDREYADGLANESKTIAQFAARGFSMPTGVLSAQLTEAQFVTQQKISEINRTIVVELAKIAVEVQKFAIGEITKLRLNMGKMLADLVAAWIDMYKAPIEAATAVVQAQAALAGVMATYANANTARIKAIADVEVHNRDVEQERFKLDFMKEMESYKAQVQGFAHTSDAFARVAAAATSAQHSMGSVNANENT